MIVSEGGTSPWRVSTIDEHERLKQTTGGVQNGRDDRMFYGVPSSSRTNPNEIRATRRSSRLRRREPISVGHRGTNISPSLSRDTPSDDIKRYGNIISRTTTPVPRDERRSEKSHAIEYVVV